MGWGRFGRAPSYWAAWWGSVSTKFFGGLVGVNDARTICAPRSSWTPSTKQLATRFGRVAGTVFHTDRGSRT